MLETTSVEHVILQAGRMLFACGVLCTIHLFMYCIHGFACGKRCTRIQRNFLGCIVGILPMFTFSVAMMAGGGRGDQGVEFIFDGYFKGLCQTLWEFDQRYADGYSHFYHWLNIVEGTFWIVFGVMVIRRYLKNHHSLIEVAYAMAFFVFGYSDYHEAYIVQPWLILLKGYVLVMILWLRKIVIKRYYPNSKTY